MTIRKACALLLPAFLLFGDLPAQNTVGFSFDGSWLASGREREGNPTSPRSYVSLKVDGFDEVQVPIPRGASAEDMTLLCITALARAGFNVTYEGPTKFRVTSHISGRPIGGGGAIGENDDDMDGTDLDVVLASLPFGQPGGAPPGQGYAIARPTGTVPSQGGTIVTTLEFEGATAPTVITVNVPPGSFPQQIDMMMFQAFVQHGITPRPWVAPHMFQPGATQPLFGLVSDTLGRRVSHVAFEPHVETEIVAMHLQSCMPISAGVTKYGWSWPASGTMQLDSASNPRIGAPLQVDLQTGLALSFAGLVVGFDDWSMPLPQLLNGTPAPATNGPTLFVQPAGSTLAGFTDAQGVLHYSLSVPPDPAFIGAPLRWQGFDINAPGPTTVWLSNGLITNIGA